MLLSRADLLERTVRWHLGDVEEEVEIGRARAAVGLKGELLAGVVLIRSLPSDRIHAANRERTVRRAL